MRGAGLTELPAQLVIRRVAPVRRVLLAAAIAIAITAAVYLTYERGRLDAGYDRAAAAEERQALEGRIAKLESANQSLSARVAELDTLRIGQTQERAELARSIGELQAQSARQTQEIAFYRSILSQGASARGEGLELRDVRITPGASAGEYRVQLTLLERTQPEAEAKGTLHVSVAGTQGGKPVTLDEAALTGGKRHEDAFGFRYFQTLEEDIVLPQGFRPERLTVEAKTGARPSAHDAAAAAPLSQSFPWRVDAP